MAIEAVDRAMRGQTSPSPIWEGEDGVIAWLLDPTLFRGQECAVLIEREGACAGRTIVDWWKMYDRPANAMVMREADAGRFFDLLTKRLARL